MDRSTCLKIQLGNILLKHVSLCMQTSVHPKWRSCISRHELCKISSITISAVLVTIFFPVVLYLSDADFECGHRTGSREQQKSTHNHKINYHSVTLSSLHASLAQERYDNASFSMDKSSERLVHLKPSFACRGPVDCAIEDGSVGDGGPGDRS